MTLAVAEALNPNKPNQTKLYAVKEIENVIDFNLHWEAAAERLPNQHILTSQNSKIIKRGVIFWGNTKRSTKESRQDASRKQVKYY